MSDFMLVMLTLVAVALVVAFARLVRGPSLLDRVTAVDILAADAVVFLAVLSVGGANPVYLDIAIFLALVSFVGTVAFARYVEWRAKS
jgi:multicomponent Na+:H+ antiporter subunit F